MGKPPLHLSKLAGNLCLYSAVLYSARRFRLERLSPHRCGHAGRHYPSGISNPWLPVHKEPGLDGAAGQHHLPAERAVSPLPGRGYLLVERRCPLPGVLVPRREHDPLPAPSGAVEVPGRALWASSGSDMRGLLFCGRRQLFHRSGLCSGVRCLYRPRPAQAAFPGT